MANVSGREKVWVNHHDKGDFDTYALSIGSKKQDGTWLNYSQECRFTRGIEKAVKHRMQSHIRADT